MFRRGTIKVMNGPNGSRIQEELNDTVKIYSAEEWAVEVKKREAEYEEELKNGPKKPVKVEEPKDTGLIEEDTDEADDEIMAEVKTPAVEKVKKVYKKK